MPRYNTGIHDPLYASCIYLDDGSTQVAIVSMDLLFYSKKYVKQLRKKLSDSLNINEKNFIFCTTHTHSGPWASGRLDLEAIIKGLQPDEEYMQMLQDKLFNLVKDSYENRFDAEVGVGIGYCGAEQGVGGNRRNPEGPSDPEVCVIAIKDMQGRLKGCLAKYALHPTVIHSDSTLVTADYPGYIRKHLAENIPGMVFAFAQGTSGDQSTRYFRKGQTFDEAERIGTAIGAEVKKVLDGMVFKKDARLYIKSEEIDWEFRKLPAREEAEKAVRQYEEQVKYLESIGASNLEIWNTKLKLYGAEDILGYVLCREKGILPDIAGDESPCEICVIGIDDTRIVTVQGEIFVEFGLLIKKQSPFGRTFVIELANGLAPGYVYTEDALSTGGYETDTSMLSYESGYKIVRKAVDMLNNSK